ncbi:uncharacterized protein LOC107626392 [Arachis ipaensis]|uniref:uncharacterized protein LOC107626392 n=1 Tax=Arachis ipaensis TaxID=130454 RepID=UPI0007AF369D|nr:uncharacterized protein LOC107626392 [Arachis ipaensis]
MGNCLVLHCHENNMVRVMKSDGKILEYKAPIKVHQVLAQFSGYHAISNSLQPIHHLHPNTKLLKGQIFYLVPISPSLSPSPKSSSKKKKKVRFAEQEVVVEGKGAKENINTNDDDNNNNNGVVRIKIVISKQQLHDMMMQKGEIISVDELLSLVDHGENSNDEEFDDDNNNNDGSIGWKPCLESIPELC